MKLARTMGRDFLRPITCPARLRQNANSNEIIYHIIFIWQHHPSRQTPFRRLTSYAADHARGSRLRQFFKCTAQNKLCSELGRRCGQTRNKTDERDSRPERDGDSRSSPGDPPSCPGTPPPALPFKLKTAPRAKLPFYCHLHLG